MLANFSNDMKDEPIIRILADGRCQIDFGFNSDGKQVRRIVADQEEAKEAIAAHKRDIKKMGEFWVSMKQIDREATVLTLKQIKADGLTLQEVWGDHQRWRKDNAKSITTPMPYEDVVKSHKEAQIKGGTGERYANEVEGLFNRFGKGRMTQPIHQIPTSDLQTWLDDQRDPKTSQLWSRSTKRTQIGRFSGLWEHAIRKGWDSRNITDRLDKIGRIELDNRIYENNIVLNIMAGAMSNDLTQAIIAPLALGFWGCMRPEEVESKKAIKANKKGEPPFGWDNINLNSPGTTSLPHGGVVKHKGTANVERWIAKKGDQRVIRLQPTGVLWLELAKELKNPLPPVNERRLIDQVCELIGLEEWIRDGLRKCCATHLRPIYKNDYDVVKDMGNSIRVLLKHYAALSIPEDVSFDYFNVTPDRVRKYMKTKAWRDVLTAAATKPAHQASGSATSAN
jgi:hypothetical protein